MDLSFVSKILIASIMFIQTVPLSAEIKFSHRVNSFATHQPVLYEIASTTTGAIVEFGCGHGSTDLLHEVCKKEGRLLITIDDDFEWLTKFSQKYLHDGYEADNSGWHKFFFVPGKNMAALEDPAHWVNFLDNCDIVKDTFFDLCFFDQSPWLGRIETIKRLKNHSKYVLLHDCDFFPTHHICGKVIRLPHSRRYIDGIYDFSDVFSYFKVYHPLKPWPLFSGPPTLLGSDFESEFPEVDFRKY